MSAVESRCPHCNADLQGDPIPEEHRQHKPDCEERKANSRFGNCYCLPYGDATHGRREIGVEMQGVYDGVLFWVCPDCGMAWPRFADELMGRLTQASMQAVAVHNESLKESA